MGDRIGFEREGDVARLRMDDGRANAMQLEWCAELHALLDRCEAEGVRAIVLSGRPGFFSGGLDLKVLPGLDREGQVEVTTAFMEAMRRVFLLPIPVVAASEGHAIAGGMMLYLGADHRIALDDADSRYGLNEARTGIPLLGGTAGICQYGIPPEHHTELILHGKLVSARATLERGITQRLVASPQELGPAAAEVAADLATLDRDAYRLNKLLLRRPAWEQAVERASALAGQAPSRNVFADLAR